MTGSVADRLQALFSADESGVVTAYLFGSAARNELRADSDLDVGVLLAKVHPPGIEACLLLEARIERLLGRMAQVVDLQRAPADLVQRVLRDGIVLLDRDPAIRVRFEVRRRNEWFDLQPLLRRLSPRSRVRRDRSRSRGQEARAHRRVRRGPATARATDRDIREPRFVEHTRQVAIQAAIDVGLHISDQRLEEPRTNREVFDLLERASIPRADLAATLRRMVGFRNVPVHGYDDVDLAVVRDIPDRRLDDLLSFVGTVGTRFGV